MSRILTFNEFNELNESDSKFSPIETYKAVALGVSRAYNLMWSLLMTADPVDKRPDEFGQALKKSISYDNKWNTINNSAKDVQKDLIKFAGILKNPKFNIGELSKNIIEALSNFKIASDILVDELADVEIKKRVSLIDLAFSATSNSLTESLLVEKDGQWVPNESDVLNYINAISSEIVALRSLGNSIIELYPKSKSYMQNVIDIYLNPIADKVSEILNKPLPTSELKLSKSVKRSYHNRGLKIEGLVDKRNVDSYEKLDKLRTELASVTIKIRKGIRNVVKGLGGEKDATLHIEAGNRMLDLVEKEISQKERLEDLERRSELMIPIGHDEKFQDKDQEKSADRQEPLVDPEELRKFLRRKYS